VTVLYVAAGGLIGTLSRYYLQGWIQQRAGSSFPLGTLVINLAGSLVLGFVLRLATGATVISPEWRAALTVGFCGAFTTMSTFSYEGVRLLGDGEYWYAGLYIGGTVVGCFLAVVGGTVMANKLL
jgi:fluoride exporter